VTEYLDEALEAARLVPCAEVWRVIKEVAQDAAYFRCYLAVRMLDLARVPLAPEEAAKRLGVGVRRLLGMRREFWQAVYAAVSILEGRA
jgi:hypothetical protein